MPRKTAKLFISEHSQTARLPAEPQLDGGRTYIRPNGATKDVTLSPTRLATWDDLLAAHAALTDEDRKGFLRDRQQPEIQHRTLSTSGASKP